MDFSFIELRKKADFKTFIKHSMTLLIFHKSLLDTCKNVTWAEVVYSPSVLIRVVPGMIELLRIWKFITNSLSHGFLFGSFIFHGSWFLSSFLPFFLSFNWLSLTSKLCLLLLITRESLIQVSQNIPLCEEIQWLFDVGLFYETELLRYFCCFSTSVTVPELPFPTFVLLVGFLLAFGPVCIESSFVRGLHYWRVCFTLNSNDNILKVFFKKGLELKCMVPTF